MKPRLKFEVKAITGSYWWRCLSGRNGEILFASETYSRRNSAVKAMEKFIAAVSDGDYEIVIDKPRRNRPTPM